MNWNKIQVVSRTQNEILHIPRIIHVKFHYNQITNIFRTLMVTMGTVAILKTNVFFLNSCEIPLQSDQNKYFFPVENNPHRNL